MKQIEVLCPTCKKKFNYFSSLFRPFCSEKCRLIDLGQWLNESYSVPMEKKVDDENELIPLRDDNFQESESSDDNSDY